MASPVVLAVPPPVSRSAALVQRLSQTKWPCNLPDVLATNARARLGAPATADLVTGTRLLADASRQLAASARRLLQQASAGAASSSWNEDAADALAAHIVRLSAGVFVAMTDAELATHMMLLARDADAVLVPVATCPKVPFGSTGTHEQTDGTGGGTGVTGSAAPPAEGFIGRWTRRIGLLLLVMQLGVFVGYAALRMAFATKRVTGDLARLDPVTTTLFYAGAVSLSAWSPHLLLLSTDYGLPFVTSDWLADKLPGLGLLNVQYQALAVVTIKLGIMAAISAVSRTAIGKVRDAGRRMLAGRANALWLRIRGLPAGPAAAVPAPVAVQQPLLAANDQREAAEALAHGIGRGAEQWNVGWHSSQDGVVALQHGRNADGARLVAAGIRAAGPVASAEFMDEFASLVANKLAARLLPVLRQQQQQPPPSSLAVERDTMAMLAELEAVLDQALDSAGSRA